MDTTTNRLATGNAENENMGEPSLPRTIQMPMEFTKSPHFRVIHASGAWYRGDAQQNLHLTFFNESSPFPSKVVLNLNEQGAVLSEDESKREIKEGFVREMEVDIVFSIPGAVDFYRTLEANLKAVKAI